MNLPPLPNCLEILTLVLCVEVRECLWLILIVPHLAQHARVSVAHENLPQSVEAVCYGLSANLVLRVDDLGIQMTYKREAEGYRRHS
jgi:hypothetical protein